MDSLAGSFQAFFKTRKVSYNSTPINLRTMNENAELQNGRWAMIGFLAAIGAYAATGNIIPGIF